MMAINLKTLFLTEKMTVVHVTAAVVVAKPAPMPSERAPRHKIQPISSNSCVHAYRCDGDIQFETTRYEKLLMVRAVVYREPHGRLPAHT